MLRKATIVCFFCLTTIVLHAQTRLEIANLIQDVELLKAEVGRLKLTVQLMTKENMTVRKDMRVVVDAQAELSKSYHHVLIEADRRIELLRGEILKANESQKDEIISKVSRQLEQYSKEINKSLRDFSSASNSPVSKAPPSSKPKPRDDVTYEFTNNFPKTGIEYTIKSGDNLWKIANISKSKVQWIRDANKIADPSKLAVGQVLFVPQK